MFKGNDLGKWISDISDGTAEIDKMTESFKEASKQADKMNFKNLSVNNLISEYDNLEKKIKGGNLSVEQRVKLEDEQKSIIQSLSEMYPDIISYYDIQNGKFDNTLNSIKELSRLDKEVADIQLENKAIEAREAIPELTDRVLASQKQQEDLINRREQLGSKIEDYQKLNNELEILQQEYIKATTESNPNSNKIASAKTNLNNKMSEIQSVGSTYGDTLNTNSVEQLQRQLKSYDNQYKLLNESYIASKNQQKEAEGKLSSAEKTYIENISNKYGFYQGLDEAAKNFDKMNKEQQDSFLKAKMQVQDFIKGLEYIPTDVYTYVHLIVDNINLSMIDRTYNLLAANSITKSGYNPLDDKSLENTAKIANGLANNVTSTTGNFKELIKGNEHATGGIFSTPHLGLVAEAGLEAIIPLSGANRERGVELWHQAGDRLGMFEEQKEIPTSYIGETRYDFLNSEEEAPPNPISPVSVTLTGGVNITINGGTNLNDGKAIVKAIREQMPTIADELCEEIAIGVKKAFDNMPLASG